MLYFQAFFGIQFCTFDNNTTHSTWLDCSRLMSDFSGCSREFIKACFFRKIHRFLPLYVLGNRSKALLLPIICKGTDLPTASRPRSEGTSLKSHRLNIRILLNPFSGLKIHKFFQLDIGMVIIAILTSKCLRIMFE